MSSLEKKIVTVLEGLQLWQLMMSVSAFLLILGFTGELKLIDSKLVKGQEILAITVGCFFAFAAIVLRVFPMPTQPGRHNYNNMAAKMAPSPMQIGFVSKFEDWESFDNAANDLLNEDHQLNESGKDRKISELRIELASYQGLLERRVVNGVHYVRRKK